MLCTPPKISIGISLLAAVMTLQSAFLTTTNAAERHHCKKHCPKCIERAHGNPELFYNFYVPPACGGVPAQLYVAPQPVPQHVGHTYFTYQPLMPHEYLYPHERVYHRYSDGGRGLTRTSVKWIDPPLKAFGSHLQHLFRVAR